MLREAMQAAAERIQSAQASQAGAEQAAETAQAGAAELRKQVARLQGEVSVLSQEQVSVRGAPRGACGSRAERWVIPRPHPNRSCASRGWGSSPMQSQRQVATGG